jgi:plasmid stabilization system protein ParE
MIRLRWLRRAYADWLSAMRFEARRNPDHARRVMAALDRAIDLIQNNPQIGVPMEHDPSIRGWYVSTADVWIFFAATVDEIVIRRIKPARTRPFKPHIDF